MSLIHDFCNMLLVVVARGVQKPSQIKWFNLVFKKKFSFLIQQYSKPKHSVWFSVHNLKK